jgi:8-amino-7-oxononanoate synthase
MSGFLDALRRAAAERESRGLTRRLQTVDGRGDLVDLAGNDYLGLSRHPDVVAAAAEAAHRYGAGARASRLVSGTLPVHVELERTLAAWVGTPSALTFSSGYLANVGALTALADADTLIVSDAHVHASLIDGARLARGTVAVNRHNDVAHVEELLRTRAQPKAMVVAESIYSVGGDAAPLADLADVAATHGAVLLLDEAHGLGVAGPRGKGASAAAGIAGRDDVVVVATLSKSLGAQGGAVLAHPLVREHLVNTARTFIYDTGLAPAAAAAANAALGVLSRRPDLPARVHEHARTLADACRVPAPAGAVLSVVMRGPAEALAAVHACAENRLLVGCFRPPSTPDGSSRLRLTAHADLTDEQVHHAARVLKQVTA